MLTDRRSLDSSSENFRKKMSFHLIKELWIWSRGKFVPHVFPVLQVLFDRNCGPSKLCLLKAMHRWHFELNTGHCLSTQLIKACNKDTSRKQKKEHKRKEERERNTEQTPEKIRSILDAKSNAITEGGRIMKWRGKHYSMSSALKGSEFH